VEVFNLVKATGVSEVAQMKRVLIIQGQMKQYRVPFYARLYEALRVDGIELKVAYSDPPPSEAKKKDSCDLPAEYALKVKGYWLLKERLLYQRIFRPLWKSDLVIVEQANKNVLNHPLLVVSLSGLQRVAFWGHGKFPQGSAISEWYKRKTLNCMTWWFAYTKGAGKYLEEHGVPARKITVVQNSVDTREIRKHRERLTGENRKMLRRRLGIRESAPVGIFCGMLDEAKGIAFLIESCKIVRTHIPEFHMILVGGGPNQEEVLQLIGDLNWVHWVGPKFGSEKTELMAISDVFLLPGRVGLAILDAFAAGLPFLTTRLDIHCPEIEYLEEDRNGLVTDHCKKAFAEEVIRVFTEPGRLKRLAAGAAESAEKYSIEAMTENFRRGIQQCLDKPIGRKQQFKDAARI
jgi:glycosyltransferase involved in cell wall biosynthesis